jgi:hypothetical protein
MGYTTGFSFFQGNGGFVGRGLFGSSNNATGSVQDRLAELSFDLMPLPVKLTGLTATARNGVNFINWTVAEEDNIDRYEIERSADGKKYDYLGDVAPSTPTASIKNYSFSDKTATAATDYYYRLKMVELNNQSTYSPVVRLKASPSSLVEIAAFPNPFTDKIRLSVVTEHAGLCTYALKDVTGKSLMSGSYSIARGRNDVTLPGVESLAKGVYFLSVRTTGGEQVLKLSK